MHNLIDATPCNAATNLASSLGQMTRMHSTITLVSSSCNRWKLEATCTTEYLTLPTDWKGFLSRRKKDGSAAIALLRRALEVNAEDADALGELAYLEWQVLKDVESARKHFADAMRVAPEHGLNRGKLAQFVKVNGEL